VQEVYRTLFKSKHNISQALEIVKNEIEPTEERDTILEFIEKSSQGIVRGYHQKS
jgi:UDP-N-acetylglucosamine acyltransferase